VVTAFKKCEGVTDADADCHKGTATVKFDSKKTSVDKLIETALKGTEYKASKMEEKKKEG
jgi:copper chaperone CopZ